MDTKLKDIVDTAGETRSVLCITSTTINYVDFTCNLYKSWAMHQQKYPLHVLCLDDEANFDMQRRNIPAHRMNLVAHDGLNSTLKRDTVLNSETYVQMMFQKLDILLALMNALPSNAYIFWIDGDCVIKNNVDAMLDGLVIKADIGKLDAVFQCYPQHFDMVKNNTSLPCSQGIDHICAGIMLVRKTDSLMRVLDYKQHLEVPMNDSRLKDVYPFGDETYIRKISDRLNYAFMNPALVEIGTFVTNGSIHKDALIIHFNNAFGRDKLKSMKENGYMYCDTK